MTKNESGFIQFDFWSWAKVYTETFAKNIKFKEEVVLSHIFEVLIGE
jgi:hypothetical protein